MQYVFSTSLCSLCSLWLILQTPLNLSAAQELPLTPFVNLFIGTAPNPQVKAGPKADAGNVFPGAVCPRGMVAWSPDTTHADKAPGGYFYADPTIRGFSLTHFSGRGMMFLMDVPFMPVAQPVEVSPGSDWSRFAAPFSHTNETALPGSYRVKFDNGIETELTASLRTGLGRFTFPAKSTASLLIKADGAVTINGNELTGYHEAGIAGGKQPYTLYFAAQFDRPFQSAKTWLGETIHPEPAARGKVCGAILAFDTATNSVVQVRVGISYVSVENAKANLAETAAKDFATVRQEANAAWNSRLNRIQVQGGTDQQKQVFYTALYHCFIHPNLLEDINGQYPGMDGKVHTVEPGRHQYQNIPAWDQYRSHSPLIAILAPDESSDTVQSLVNYAQQDAAARPNGGGLPRWEQINRNSGGMVGDGDDAIIAWSYAFGAGRFDTKAALAAMDKGASCPDTTSDGAIVRSGLKEYMQLGYVPGRASITLEYCNHDFALAQFAKALGDGEKSVAYQNRAQNWTNLFDASTGYLRPRNADGSWPSDFSPAAGKGFTEGSAAQYLWMVNFNLRSLIDKLGGNDKAVERLDKFFAVLNSGGRAETAWMGNEPGEGAPWVYDFAGAPSRAQAVVRRVQTELFTTLPSGLPGNDDAGALSSWYIFSALGLYPEIPGVAGFVVGSPLFSEATVHLGNGSTLRILGNQACAANAYVKSMKLDGRDYDRCWIPWPALAKGAVLSFELGDKPTQWASRPEQAPPSFDVVKP
jgi:predicted alpha-1,2-mannosidase